MASRPPVIPRQQVGVMPPVAEEIARAFENDPRTKLANSMISSGASTSPVAAGKYAWADGIARALSGVAGGYIQRKQQKKYREQEDQFNAIVAEALSKGAPAGESAVPGGVGGTQSPVQPVNSGAGPAGGLGVPPAPPHPQPLGSASVPSATPSAVTRGPELASLGALPPNMAPPPAVEAFAAPEAAPPIAAGQEAPQRPAAPVRTAFLDPLGGKGRGTSSLFGEKRKTGSHNGIDYRAPGGTAILAAAPGEVIAAGTDNLSGNFVRIRHPDGSVTGYAHMSKPPALEVGQPVDGGTPIGTVGSTGRSTGNHLHFTVTDAKGRKVDPRKATWTNSGAAAQPQQQPDEVAAAANVARPEITTPEPAMPDMPNAPAPIGAVRSGRADAGRKMLASGNPFAAALGRQFVEKGLGEEFIADSDEAGRRFDIDKTGFQSSLNDFYDARSSSRTAAHNARQSEREAGQTFDRDTRQFGHDRSMQDDEQDFTATEAERKFGRDKTMAGIEFGYAKELAELDNDAAYKRTVAQIDASREKEADKVAAKQAAFLSTPQGSRMYQQATDTIQKNETVIDQVKQFLSLNDRTTTGGVASQIPGMVTFQGIGNADIRDMDAITDLIAPMLRQAGSGAMSDKDLASFRNSLPSVKSTGKANKSMGERIVRSMERVNDFERSKIEAASQGRQAEFTREWQAYRSAVPVASGKSFNDWKSSLVQLDANGKRK